MKKIRIVSPAKSISKELVVFAQNWLVNKGFQVELGKHVMGEYNYFSGTDLERFEDMQEALDSDADIILCARGGYGSVRIIDQLDWTKFRQQPKLICGYSDITVFHNRMNKMGFASLHCTAPLNFQENCEEALISMTNAFLGSANQYRIEPHLLNRAGHVEAETVGGNLAILSTLCGTDDELKTKGKILFIEDVGEAVYAVDRMMWQLKKAGLLSNLAGLIVGGMTSMKDSAIPFGKSVEEVVSEIVAEHDYPVCFNFPAGHIDDNRAILFGEKARLLVNKDASSFIQQVDGI